MIRFVLENAADGNKGAVMAAFADEFKMSMDRGPETMTAEGAWADIQLERDMTNRPVGYGRVSDSHGLSVRDENQASCRLGDGFSRRSA